MEAALLFILNNSISSVWVVLAVVLLRLLLRWSPKRIVRILWVLPALRLMLPFSIESVVSLIPDRVRLSQDVLTAVVPEVNNRLLIVDNSLNPVLQMSSVSGTAASVNPMQGFIYIGALVWLIGLAIMLLLALISILRLRRRLAEAVHESGDLWRSDMVQSPFILGLIHPRIYLPCSLNGKALDMVLAHERCHLKSGDHIFKLLAYLLLSVYWFNPLIWLAFILFCRDTELACDEKVIAAMDITEKKNYSMALLDCAIKATPSVLCPLAFGEVGVKERIKKVLNFKKSAVWLSVLAIVIVGAAAICLLTDPKDTSESVGIIGGADGPTAIFISGNTVGESDDRAVIPGVYLTLDFDDAEKVYSLDVKAAAGDSEHQSTEHSYVNDNLFRRGERIYLDGMYGFGSKASFNINAKDKNGKYIATASFNWAELNDGGITELVWSEADLNISKTRERDTGIYLTIDERFPFEFYSVTVDAVVRPAGDSGKPAKVQTGVFQHADGTPYAKGEKIYLEPLEGITGIIDFFVMPNGKETAALGSYMVTIDWDGKEALDVKCLPIPNENAVSTQLESDEFIYLETANAELSKLYEMGLLKSEMIIEAEGCSVRERVAQEVPDNWYPGRLLPKLYYVRGNTADSDYQLVAFLDVETGKIINLSITSKELYNIFPEDMTMDRFCTILNDYWGFDGYSIVDTEGEYGHFDAPKGSDKLGELERGNFYASIRFEGDQPGATVSIQPLRFPEYAALIFGFNGHTVG